MSYFYEQEKTGGRLDIKEPDKWKEAFNDEIPWLGKSIENESARFLYNNEVMTADILGNFAYGYWGKAMGFTDDEIYYGGGFAKLKKQNGKSIIGFISDPTLMANWALDPLYAELMGTDFIIFFTNLSHFMILTCHIILMQSIHCCIVKHSDGTSTNIHFVYNEISGAFDDFKFK